MVQKWREGCSLKDIFDVSNGIKQKGIEKREIFTFKMDLNPILKSNRKHRYILGIQL